MLKSLHHFSDTPDQTERRNRGWQLFIVKNTIKESKQNGKLIGQNLQKNM